MDARPRSDREGLFGGATLEDHHSVVGGGDPLLLIAINEGDVVGKLRRAILEQAEILVFAIGDTLGAVLFDEGDGEELAFGVGNHFFEVGLDLWVHWLCGFYWLLLVCFESLDFLEEFVNKFFLVFKVALEDFEGIDKAEDTESGKSDEGDDEWE